MRLSDTQLPPKKPLIRDRYDFDMAVKDAAGRWERHGCRADALDELVYDICERNAGYFYDDACGIRTEVDEKYIRCEIVRESLMRDELDFGNPVMAK